MKVLHLEASTGWGGQEIRILKECLAMRKANHSVFLAVMHKAMIAKKAKEQDLPVFEMNFKKPYWIQTLFQLIFLIKKHKIQIVNTHSSLDSWIGGLAAKICGCKVVRTRHLSTPIAKGLNSRLLYGKLADFVVTTCQEIVSMIANQSQKNIEMIQSVPTGVEIDKIAISAEEGKEFRIKYNIPEDAFLVGTVCVMRSWKGLDTFLQAAKEFKDNPKIIFCVVGGGHEKTYHKMAQDLGLKDNIRFTGHLDHPFAAMQAFDVFLLLSTKNEGVSQAILQASFLKKPLIATETGGLKEVCLEGKTGFIVPVLDVQSTKNAILKLFLDESLRRRFGENAHNLVKQEFSFDKTIEQMQNIYEKVLQMKS